MTEKLHNKLVTAEIKQTSNKKRLIAFRDSAIDKIKKLETDFELKRFKWFKFDVSKGTSLKGLLLRFTKATERKDFIINFWFKGKGQYCTIGQFPNLRCKDVERICLELAETHQDNRDLWIKNPLQTKADEKSLIEELTPGNIEDWCKDLTSMAVKKDYVKVFTSLWFWARKREIVERNWRSDPSDGLRPLKKIRL